MSYEKNCPFSDTVDWAWTLRVLLLMLICSVLFSSILLSDIHQRKVNYFTVPESEDKMNIYATTRDRAIASIRASDIVKSVVFPIDDNLRKEFHKMKPFPHTVIDDLFPVDILLNVVHEPDEFTESWLKEVFDRKGGLNKRKLQLKAKKHKWRCIGCSETHQSGVEGTLKIQNSNDTTMGPKTRGLIDALRSKAFLKFLEKLSGISPLFADPSNWGSGLHQTLSSGSLQIHADYRRHPSTLMERRVNVFLYMNPDWAEEYGGHLELWNRALTKCQAKILPLLNRLVIFLSDDWSYHGQAAPLTCPWHRTRRSIAMYYYSPKSRPAWTIDTGARPFHKTLYQQTRCRECLSSCSLEGRIDETDFLKDFGKGQQTVCSESLETTSHEVAVVVVSSMTRFQFRRILSWVKQSALMHWWIANQVNDNDDGLSHYISFKPDGSSRVEPCNLHYFEFKEKNLVQRYPILDNINEKIVMPKKYEKPIGWNYHDATLLEWWHNARLHWNYSNCNFWFFEADVGTTGNLKALFAYYRQNPNLDLVRGTTSWKVNTLLNWPHKAQGTVTWFTRIPSENLTKSYAMVQRVSSRALELMHEYFEDTAIAYTEMFLSSICVRERLNCRTFEREHLGERYDPATLLTARQWRYINKQSIGSDNPKIYHALKF